MPKEQMSMRNTQYEAGQPLDKPAAEDGAITPQYYLHYTMFR
jgi:hypothetical protein